MISKLISEQSLNPAQLQAACTEEPSILILAGAGSGKTRVLVSRIMWLLENTELKPYEILALTFTNKATQEMRERLHKMSQLSYGVFLSTFHSFGAFFLRKYHENFDISRNFSIYDQRKGAQLIEHIFPDYSTAQRQQYYERIQSFKDGSLSPVDQQEIQNVIVMYNDLLRKNNAVDFGDLLYLPLQHLQKNKVLQTQVQQRWKAILVDEYQDTNRTQDQLLTYLKGPQSWITVIGDDDQTIYRFRGSDPSNIKNFIKNMPETKIFILEQNYRSSLAILNCANRLIKQNTNRISKNLFSTREGAKPKVLRFLAQESECQYLCSLIQKDPHKETAILYRNNFQRYPVEESFRKWRIPYIVLGASSFYEQEEIKTLLAWASFLSNPCDQTSFIRVCRVPAQGFGKKSIDIILSAWKEMDNASILDALNACKDQLPSKAKKNSQNFYDKFMHWNQILAESSLKIFFEIFVKETGLYEFYFDSDQKNDTHRLDSIRGLIKMIKEDDLYGHEGLFTFLDNINLVGEKTNDNDTPKNRIILTTIHQAKGLEFERVIILGMDEGIFPKPAPNHHKNEFIPTITLSLDEIEDERRLCYVAVTRAKSELLMTCCSKRWWFNGQNTHHNPSRFLSEIGNELFEFIRFDDHQQYRYGTQNQHKSQLFKKTAQIKTTTAKKYSTPPKYSVGDSIRHKDHGKGKVLKVEYIANRYVVTVRFQDQSTKKFLTEFASMEKTS